MIIPFQLLAPETLQQVIEDFVTRDGTDNGDDTPLITRVQKVKEALAKKQAFILFDSDSETCSLALKQDVPQAWLNELE